MVQAVKESLPYLKRSLNAQLPSFGFLVTALKDSSGLPSTLLIAVTMEAVAYSSSSEEVGVANF